MCCCMSFLVLLCESICSGIILVQVSVDGAANSILIWTHVLIIMHGIRSPVTKHDPTIWLLTSCRCSADSWIERPNLHLFSLLCTTCQHTSTFLYVAFIGRTKLILLLLYNALMLETHHVRCEQRIAYRDTYLWFSFLHKIECSAFRSSFCVWHQADWQVLELRTK
jgi:hypothetical protein